MGVHPSAIVSDGAEIGADVDIGPFCFLGPQVRLGDGCRLHSHVVIDGDTHLGEQCVVFPQAVLGSLPQDKKIRPEDPQGQLRIGSHNQIREHVTIHGGTIHGRGVTQVGNHIMLLATCHIGHDAEVGDHVVMTNGSMVAGHALVENHAILGAMAGVHQFTRVGQYSMIGAAAMVTKDAPPFSLIAGDRAKLYGVNVIGLKRAGFDSRRLGLIKQCYRQLFWSGGTLAERVENTRPLAGDDPAALALLEFLGHSLRGLTMPRGRKEAAEEKFPSNPT